MTLIPAHVIEAVEAAERASKAAEDDPSMIVAALAAQDTVQALLIERLGVCLAEMNERLKAVERRLSQ